MVFVLLQVLDRIEALSSSVEGMKFKYESDIRSVEARTFRQLVSASASPSEVISDVNHRNAFYHLIRRRWTSTNDRKHATGDSGRRASNVNTSQNHQARLPQSHRRPPKLPLPSPLRNPTLRLLNHTPKCPSRPIIEHVPKRLQQSTKHLLPALQPPCEYCRQIRPPTNRLGSRANGKIQSDTTTRPGHPSTSDRSHCVREEFEGECHGDSKSKRHYGG